MDDYLAYANPDRIAARINQLAAITEPERLYTRLVFSPEFDAGRCWLECEFIAAGLICKIDAGGNLIGTRTGIGSEPQKKLIVGSHIDTVPGGGRFDGIVGVLAALEVVHYLNDYDIALPFDLEIVDFLGEELNVWGTSCLGSRHMAGLITPEMLQRTDQNGRILGSEIAHIGGRFESSQAARCDADQILGCFELHIEQGKVLQSKAADVGVVTTIAGIYRYGITVTGQASHSGTTRMEERRDALVAAADIIQATNGLASKIAHNENQHFVATIGKIDVFPNGATVIPERVEMTLDLRTANENGRVLFEQDFDLMLAQTGTVRHCEISCNQIAAATVAPMDANLRRILSEESAALGLSAISISSGAGHDSAHLSRFAPAAMIFIPCRDGLSHCPEEFASTEAITKGAAVLVRSVIAMQDQTSFPHN